MCLDSQQNLVAFTDFFKKNRRSQISFKKFLESAFKIGISWIIHVYQQSFIELHKDSKADCEVFLIIHGNL